MSDQPTRDATDALLRKIPEHLLPLLRQYVKNETSEQSLSGRVRLSLEHGQWFTTVMNLVAEAAHDHRIEEDTLICRLDFELNEETSATA